MYQLWVALTVTQLIQPITVPKSEKYCPCFTAFLLDLCHPSATKMQHPQIMTQRETPIMRSTPWTLKKIRQLIMWSKKRTDNFTLSFPLSFFVSFFFFPGVQTGGRVLGPEPDSPGPPGFKDRPPFLDIV